MKCQIPFTGKNKKNIINLSSAENAQRVVKVNEYRQHKPCMIISLVCLRKKNLEYKLGIQVLQALRVVG